MTLGPEHGIKCDRRIKNADHCLCEDQTQNLPVEIGYFNGSPYYDVVGTGVIDNSGDLVIVVKNSRFVERIQKVAKSNQDHEMHLSVKYNVAPHPRVK